MHSGAYTTLSTVQLNLNTCAARARHDTFFISHACKPVCARKIGDTKPTVQSSRVRTRRVHDAHMHFRNAHAKIWNTRACKL